MAFPGVRQTATDGEASTTTHVVTLPVGYQAGDLLIIAIGVHNVSPVVSTPAGWTALANVATGTSGQNLAIFYTIAAGTEGASVSVTQDIAGAANALAFAITGGTFDPATAPAISAQATGSSTAPDPASLTPAWGSADDLWLAIAGLNASLVSTYPSGYSSNQLDSSSQGGTATPRLAAAAKTATASSDDPAAFGWGATGSWVAFTVAIKPASSGMLALF